ncbi:MAG: cupin domain-containing protein [Opitutaceae bacterium]|nr:cupin domain-containing protein [Opitutaceae bacterium]
MDEQLIGATIRQIRLSKGQTLTEVAKLASLTKSTLSKIETGQVSAPISTFMKIADAMGRELAEFFRKPSEQPSFVLTRKGEGDVLVRGGSKFGYTYEALAIGMQGKRAEPFILTIQPGDRKGTFAHGGQEFVYILSGKMEFTVGAEVMHLTAGDSLYFDPTKKHTTNVMGDNPVTFLCLFIQDTPDRGMHRKR